MKSDINDQKIELIKKINVLNAANNALSKHIREGAMGSPKRVKVKKNVVQTGKQTRNSIKTNSSKRNKIGGCGGCGRSRHK